VVRRRAAVQLIVEGPGDEGAVPVLLRRYLHIREDFRPDMLGTPIAANGLGNLTKDGGIEGYVRIAASRPGTQLVLVILDADKECIKERAEQLLPRCGSGVPVVLALAEKNFEDWIYASVETTLGTDIEYVAGKNGLSEIKRVRPYTKSVDQARLAHQIDFDIASSRSQSFKRLIDRFESRRIELA
jgi:hypothetical protein